MLDLIFTNDQALVSSVFTESWPRFTDHKLVKATVSYQLHNNTKTKETHLLECGRRFKQLNFNKAPWDEIQAELGKIDWSDMEEASKKSPTEALNIFMEELLPLLEKHVPVKNKKRKNHQIERRRKLLWRRLSKVKVKLKSASSINKLTKLLKNKQELEKQLYDDYLAENILEENFAISNMKTNPKAFFSFAKSRQKTRAKVGPFIDPSTGKPNPDPEYSASQLSKQYSSVFVEPRDEWKVKNPREFFGPIPEGPALEDITFTEEDIQEACKELKASSAAGADGVPATLLKNCRTELSRPLYILWRSSLDQGLIPGDLLLVLISPVHKGGSRGQPKNYRPVALTSHIVKVFERVLRKVLINHLEKNNLLPNGQHGFRELRSTLTQLLSFWDTILDQLESDSDGVDIVYTDFSKAFDKVETGVLLHKLKECGISGRVGCWLSAFLDSGSRQQAVGVDGAVSCLCPVVSGVPQGTVLGPVLFLIHISDIAASLSQGTTATSFADDTRVQRGIKSVQDCADLQADLNLIYQWAETVNMHFNSDKFECLRFWPGDGEPPNFQYLGPDINNIEVKTDLKDLGVQISTDLAFKLHIEKIVTAASQLSGWGLRTFQRRSKSVMKSIWTSLIQPKIDYCSQLWSPGDQISINKIESVQRFFTSKVEGMKELDYWDRLRELQMYSQERRRERYMIIFLWKISQGLVRGYDVTFCNSERRGRTILANKIVKSSPASVRKARECSLGVKGAQLFNILPVTLRNLNSDSVETFKNNLDSFLRLVPDQPTVSGMSRAAETNSLLHQIPMMTTAYTGH